MRVSVRLLFLVLLLIPGGCGGSTQYVPVSGTVTMDGQPLANVRVFFQPIASSGNPDAGGVGSFALTDAAGRFTLEAMTPDPQKGALPGRHMVRIGTAGDTNPDMESDAAFNFKAPVLKKDSIPESYNVNSILVFEVPPGGTDKADFPLSSTGAAPKQ